MNWQKIVKWIVTAILVFMGITGILQFIPLIAGETMSVSTVVVLFWWLIMCAVCIVASLTQWKSWAMSGLLSILLVMVNNVEFSMFYIVNHAIALIITMVATLYMVNILFFVKSQNRSVQTVF